MITLAQLAKVYREATVTRLSQWLPLLNQTMQEYEINTPARIQMFLAQVGHESGQLRYVEELASGKAYEGRLDLGNTVQGDGVRYKGRGLIQITGRRNYQLVSLALDEDFVGHPELLSTDEYACKSAGWFWSNNKLNSYCDRGDFKGLTKRINGGYNGLEDREKLYKRAKEVFNG